VPQPRHPWPAVGLRTASTHKAFVFRAGVGLGWNRLLEWGVRVWDWGTVGRWTERRATGAGWARLPGRSRSRGRLLV
jgi:hypothetical protein